MNNYWCPINFILFFLGLGMMRINKNEIKI